MVNWSGCSGHAPSHKTLPTFVITFEKFTWEMLNGKKSQIFAQIWCVRPCSALYSSKSWASFINAYCSQNNQLSKLQFELVDLGNKTFMLPNQCWTLWGRFTMAIAPESWCNLSQKNNCHVLHHIYHVFWTLFRHICALLYKKAWL